ncbi:MAG: hypothetical protein LAO30_06175 [Acidobacteriia bacterium]|nr:hypothetical protein [Terriglobia bacterium]
MKLMNYRKHNCLLAISVTVCVALPVIGANASKRMSLSDDIQMTKFLDPYPGESRTAVTKVSPDGRYFAIVTERGLIDKDVPEDTISIVKSDEVEKYLQSSDPSASPRITSLVHVSTYKDGPIINDVRWGDDSSALYFLAMAQTGRRQLFRAEINGSISPLTPDTQNVTGYAVRDDEVVYFATSALVAEQISKRHASSAYFTAEQGQSLYNILDPELTSRAASLSEVWVARAGKTWRVEDQVTHTPTLVQADFVDNEIGSLKDPAISPDGRLIVVPMPVSMVPKKWEQYRGFFIGSGITAIRSGKQEIRKWWGSSFTESYFLVDLGTGHAEQLLDAPTGVSAGWFIDKGFTTVWSSDGRLLALTNTFLPLGTDNADGHPLEADHPCVAIYDLARRNAQCVVALRTYAEGLLGIDQIRFEGLDNRTLKISLHQLGSRETNPETMMYRRSVDGSWKLDDNWHDPNQKQMAFDLVVEQDLNKPPVLAAISGDAKASRVIWDPNPEIASMNLGEASVFQWKDPYGRPWEGGLVLPPDYVRGKRYPLVIQTHGFNKHQFMASGTFTTNFAARELAAAGVTVLQVEDLHYDLFTAQDLPSAVAGYESAVDKLIEDGVVDPNRVGLAGFSRTMLDVMQALTFGRRHFAVASVADGETGGLVSYFMEDVDAPNGGIRRQFEEYFGAAPYGSGLKMWLAKSPALNLDRVTTPVLITNRGMVSLAFQWELYSGLRYLHKPVENLIVGDGTHPFTNPGQRLASQGASIDWFRFWLQSYEDPDPAKAEQYARWHELRKLQEQNDAKTQAAPAN